MELQKHSKLISLISVYFVVILLISNVVSTKILDFGSFTFDGGTILFPLSYIIGDIITEVYGYKQSRKIIWTGFWAMILMAVVVMIVGALPAAKDWPYQEDYQNILGFTPRIVLASLIAYFAGEFSNSYILAKLKIWMKGKKLWVRTIGSTIVWEFLDTIIFVMIAFYWVFWNDLLLTIILSNYIFKIGIEILFTPFTYLIVNKVKKIEWIDYYDYKTNFNPLHFWDK